MPPDPTDSDVLGDSLIPVINRLQDIFSQVTLDFKLHLPQVAVVGSQSSGKSSVLEALVGRDFLPRGPDICTRRPLVLQLVKVPPAGAPGGGKAGQPSEWGEFLHAPGKVFYDFDRIRQEIQAETERVSGPNKNISDKPIRLKICSPNVLTMTLIDLPGVTRVPVADQPSNIEARIREMILTYVREPSCIILAVSAANADIANSDALQVAQMVDPEGSRTIGVLTKLDIMDRGTNALPVLRNQVVPLRLGYVGVVLRSQADINSRKTMGDARKNEESFFSHHSEYQEVRNQVGVANLARRINTILGTHIRSMLPGLRRQIADALAQRTAELRSYGEALKLDSDSARGAALLQLLCSYAERFSLLLDGRCEDMPLSELTGGARIRHIFLEVYGRQLRQLDPLRDMSDEDVRTAIKNSGGVAGALLIPQEPFELLVRRAISRLLPPSLSCKEMVYEELLRIAEAACPRDLGRFPALQRRLASAVLEFIQAGADPAERLIRELVDCEHEYINTDHPDFIGGTRAVKVVMEEREMRRAAVGAGGGAGGSGSGAGGGHATPHSAHDANLHKAKSAGLLTDGRGGGGGGVLGLKGLHETGSSGLSDDALLVSRSRLSGRSEGFGEDLLAGSGSGGGGGGYGGGTPHSGGSWFGWLTKSERSSDKLVEGALVDVPPKSGGKPRSEHEEVQVEVIRLLVRSYFDLVRNSLADLVPKALMKFMVHHSQRGMQRHLIATLYSDQLAGELLRERDEVAQARAKCAAAVAALQAAAEALDDVPSELNAAQLSSAGNVAAAVSAPEFSLPAPLPPGRAPLGAAERHPSMHIAAQIASATGLSLSNGATLAAAAAAVGAPGMAALGGGGGCGEGASGMSLLLNGGTQGKTVTIKVDGD